MKINSENAEQNQAVPPDGLRPNVALKAEHSPLPWQIGALAEWDIVGMNHYHVDERRYLFVAMTNGFNCIRAEGGDERSVFTVLELNALALATTQPTSE